MESKSSTNSVMSSNDDDADDSLLSMNFNQDGGCLAVGTNRGFRICNVSPFQETFRRTFAASAKDNNDLDNDSEEDRVSSLNKRGGGIGAIEMLFRCNLFALVGGGTNPHYPPNKVIIWDDHSGRDAGSLQFRQRVLTVKLRRDRICVAVRDKVYVYNFANLSEVLDTITTGGEKNGPGLLCISTDAGDGHVSFSPNGRDDNGMVLACPSIPPGQVRVELYGQRKNVLIDAHEGALAAMALTVDGSLLATASVRGTIIRMFDTGKKSTDDECMSHPPGTPLREFRRGVEQAKIRCLTFSLDNLWLGCASDRGTVHVFGVKKDKKADKCKSSSSSTSKSTVQTASKLAKSFLPSMLTKSPKKYLLEGDQSYAQVRGIPHPQSCAFVPNEPNMIAVAGLDEYGNGCLLMASFGPNDESNGNAEYNTNQSCRRVAYHRFFRKGMTDMDGKNENNSIQEEGGVRFSEETDDTDGFVSVQNEESNEASTPSLEDDEDNRKVESDVDVEEISEKDKKESKTSLSASESSETEGFEDADGLSAQ